MEIDLHITNRCNLKCKHCVYTSGEWDMPDMTLDTVKKLLPSFKRMGVEEVHITGGEPLLNKEFFEIAEFLKTQKLKTRVQTNGMLITKEIAKRLKECGVEYVLISIDGLENTHNKFRNNTHSFEKAINAVKICLEAGLYTRVNTVVNRSNGQDLPKLIEHINSLNPNQHSFFYLTPIGRGKNIKELMLSLEEWREIEEIVKREAKNNNCIEKVKLQNVLKNDLTKNIGCRDDNCLILANGDVFHCVFFIYSKYKLGNIFENDLWEIWSNKDNELLKSEIEDKISNRQCAKTNNKCQCNCPGLAYVMTNTVGVCDPRCNPKEGLIPSCIRTYIKIN